MSMEIVFIRLVILLYEFDYDNAMRWLIDMYTCYMIILFDISHEFTVIDIGRSYGPLWSDICRGRIMGILWSSNRGYCGWCLARRRGWVCHSVVLWLTQANTSVGQSCIFYLPILILKTYAYYVLSCICIKKTLVISDFALAQHC